MHICCSNCSIYPLQELTGRGLEVRGLWYNPNIHPYTEYEKRLESLKKLQGLWNLDIEYADEYALDDFLKSIVSRGKDRCSFCYYMRLERTAGLARKMSFDLFTTSLLASPYQKFDMIIQMGEEIGKRHGIGFHSEDLRQGWSISRGLSKELDLYRQKYCGCIYSEMERFQKKIKTGN